MNAFENFVMIQSDAALRQVAGQYAYDDNEADTEELTDVYKRQAPYRTYLQALYCQHTIRIWNKPVCKVHTSLRRER